MSLVQSHDHEDSPLGKEVKLKWDGFVEKVGLSLEWKSEGVMDDESGDDDKDGLTCEWDESRQDRLSWRNESESWFQRRGDAYLKERSVIFNQETVGGRERVTVDEQRVLREG